MRITPSGIYIPSNFAAGDLVYGVSGNVGARLALPTKGHVYMAGSSAPIGEPIARRNLLIGGGAELWDQGTTPAIADNGYIGGNWRVLIEAANACTVTRESSDVPAAGSRWAWKVVAGTGNNNKFGLFCSLLGSDIWHLRNQVASLQAQLKIGGTLSPIKGAICAWTGAEDGTTADPISAWGAAGTNPTLGGSWAYVGTPADLGVTTSWARKLITEAGAIPSGATNLAVFIWSDDKTTTTTTDFFLLTDVQLEYGNVCTSVERLPKSFHRFLDSHYYFKTFSETTAPAQATGVLAGAIHATMYVTATNFSIERRYPMAMRATPTLTYYNPVSANNKWYNLTDGADSGSPTTLANSESGHSTFDSAIATDHAGDQMYIHFQATARI